MKKALKNIVLVVVSALFGLAYVFVKYTADAVEENIAEESKKYAKKIKVCYIALYTMLFFWSLVTIYLLGENVWMLIFCSSILLPLISYCLSLIACIIYLLLEYAISKMKIKFSSVIAFCLVSVITFSVVGGILGHLTDNAIPEVTKFTSQTTEKYYYGGHDLDYERIEPQNYGTYILNTKTKKYHRPSCSYLPSKDNAREINEGDLYRYSNYTPCAHCDP